MLENGEVLNSRYKIIRHIKSGGMGAVYEAFDQVLKARVVIKENLNEGESLAFQREAQLLANLRHPSLPYCSNFFLLEEKKQYLVMEFIEGDDLSTLMSKGNVPLKAELVLDWAKQLLDVLDYLHGEEIQHRDIKPLNIKVINGRVYLLDFGIAYGQSGGMDVITESEFNWDSYSKYSSLEQLRGERTTPASDLYSLAATLYNLLTAVQPVNAEKRFQLLTNGKDDPLKDIRVYNPDLDENVRRTIMRSLSMKPHKRPQSAREMRQMMFPEKTPQLKQKTSQLKPAVKRKFAWRKALSRVSMLCALLGILIFILASGAFKDAKLATRPSNASTTSLLSDQYADESEQLRQAGKYEEAKKKIIEALSLYPDNAYYRFIYGDLLWDIMGEMADSVASIPEVQEQGDIILRLVQSPNSEKEFLARSWACLTKAYLDKGFLEAALDDANAALRFNPNSGQGLMLRGTIKYQKAMLDGKDVFKSMAAEILDDYKRAIDIMRDYPQAYINRALILTDLGDFERAIADIKQAIKLQKRADYYFELGSVYYQLRNFQEARKNYQAAIDQNQNCYKAYLGLADLHLQRHDWKAAVEKYLLANGIHKTVYGFGQMGWAYYYLKEFEEAKRNFNEALRYNQYDFKSQHGMALSYIGLKDLKSALESYKNALASAPKDNINYQASLHRERAGVYYQLDQEELAEEDEKQAEKLEQ